jgi:hypothetical protein
MFSYVYLEVVTTGEEVPHNNPVQGSMDEWMDV